jgi:CBS-domain-containing membrane protein
MKRKVSSGSAGHSPRGAKRRHARPVASDDPIGEAPSLMSALATPVLAIMTRHTIAVHPDTSVEALTALFIERGLHGAPVVDDGGTVIGFVSQGDLLRDRFENGDTEEHDRLWVRARGGALYPLPPGYHAEALARATVKDVMMPIALSLTESTPIATAAALLAEEGVHRMPVVDEQGHVVGLLSALDVLRWLARLAGHDVRDPRRSRETGEA